jgi:hypothetical protein
MLWPWIHSYKFWPASARLVGVCEHAQAIAKAHRPPPAQRENELLTAAAFGALQRGAHSAS